MFGRQQLTIVELLRNRSGPGANPENVVRCIVGRWEAQTSGGNQNEREKEYLAAEFKLKADLRSRK
jgi:hypothetical protein